VQTRVTDQDEYLPPRPKPRTRRRVAHDRRRACVKKPQVQIVVGDGLSAAAVTNNLPADLPGHRAGLQSAGLRLGTPFFVRYCRVGVERRQRHHRADVRACC
jgi:ethanolamine ammonia-lyase small subunit